MVFGLGLYINRRGGGGVLQDSATHDGNADKDSYPHDRHNQYIMLSL